MIDKDKEIERLNFNLEVLQGDFSNILDLLDLEEGSTYYDIVDKIEELKGSDKQ